MTRFQVQKALVAQRIEQLPSKQIQFYAPESKQQVEIPPFSAGFSPSYPRNAQGVKE